VHLLESAKATLDQRTTESYDNFLRRVAEELTVGRRNGHKIFPRTSPRNTREHWRRGSEDFHQKLLEGGNSLKRLSEGLGEFLQHNLNAEHDCAFRGDLEQLRSSVALESSRLQEQVEYLDTRIAKLDESTRCMESGLDHRLSRMSSEIVKDTRSQFQSLANEILEELTARSIHSAQRSTG